MADKLEFNGTIDAVKKRTVKIKGEDKPSFSFLINEDWYSSLNPDDEVFARGDIVKGEYKQNGDFRNIVSIDTTDETFPEPAVPNKPVAPIQKPNAPLTQSGYWERKEQAEAERQILIVRQSCLNNANQFIANLIAINPGGVKEATKKIGLDTFTKTQALQFFNWVFEK